MCEIVMFEFNMVWLKCGILIVKFIEFKNGFFVIRGWERGEVVLIVC